MKKHESLLSFAALLAAARSVRAKIIVTGAALVLTALSASAVMEMEIQTDNFGGNAPGSEPPFTSSLSFSKFNTSLGTLDDIVITLSTTYMGVIHIYDITYLSPFGGIPGSIGGATVSTPVKATGPGGAFATAVAALSIGSEQITAFESNFSGEASTINSVNVAPGSFSFYESAVPGTYDVNVASGSTTVTGTADSERQFIFFGGSAKVYGSVSVEYNYTPVPDVGMTASLLGGTLIGMGALRRKLFA